MCLSFVISLTGDQALKIDFKRDRIDAVRLLAETGPVILHND